MTPTRYARPMQSDIHAGHRLPERRPYANLRAIIARAERGELPKEKPERKPKAMDISELQPRTASATRPGEIIAQRLIESDNPMSVQIVTTGHTRRELQNAQNSGTRWLARTNNGRLRVSYRRSGDQAIWTLAKRMVRNRTTGDSK